MHFARRIVRGVNGPEFLAEELGRRLKIPVLGGIVARTRATTVQYELTPRQRAANVKNAFVLKSNFALRIRRIEPRKRLEGKKILLTDDILTTGSTVDELARLLLAGGAASVDVCVLARAVGDRGNER